MKKIIIGILSCILSTSVFAGRCRVNDSWHGNDKQLHLGGGFIISTLTTMHTKDPMEGLKWGMITGATKEGLDALGMGDCSFQDFAVTSIGAAIGAYTGGLIVTRIQGTTTIAYNITLK